MLARRPRLCLWAHRRVLLMLLAALSIAAMLMVPAEEIDDELARGLAGPENQQSEQPSGLSLLLRKKPPPAAVRAALRRLPPRQRGDAALCRPAPHQGRGQGQRHLADRDLHRRRAMRDGADGGAGRRQGRQLGRKPIFLAAFVCWPCAGALHLLRQPLLPRGGAEPRRRRRRHLRRAVPDRGRRPHPRHRPFNVAQGRSPPRRDSAQP